MFLYVSQSASNTEHFNVIDNCDSSGSWNRFLLQEPTPDLAIAEQYQCVIFTKWSSKPNHCGDVRPFVDKLADYDT